MSKVGHPQSDWTFASKWLLEGSFLVAFALAFALGLLALGAERSVQHITQGIPDAYVLTRVHQVPSDDGPLMMRVGFPTADARILSERVGPSAEVGFVGMDSVVADSAGRRVALDVLVLSPVAFGLVVPGGSCHESTLWLDASIAHRLVDQPISIGTSSYRGVATDLRRTQQWLGLPGPIAALCREQGPVAIAAVLAHGSALTEATLASLAQDRALFSGEMFGVRLKFDKLDASVRAALESQFAWAQGLAWAAPVLLSLLFVAWGILQGVSVRRANIQRRIFGASRAQLTRKMLARALARAALALVLASLALQLAVGLQGTGVQADLDWAAMGWLSVLAVVSALIPVWTMSIRRVDSDLREAMGGTHVTAAMRPYMLLWAVSLAASMVAVTLAASIALHARNVLNTDLGYQPEGLATLPVRVDQDDDLRRMQAEVLQSAYNEGADVASLICFPPWEFSGHSAVIGNDSTIGAGMGAGPSILKTLQVRAFTGRDFESFDMGVPVMMMQGKDDVVSVMSRSRANLIARIDGLMVGALRPESRLLSIQPIAALDCRSFAVLARGLDISTAGLRAFSERVASSFPEIAVGEATLVSKLISTARQPLSHLAWFLITAALLAAGQQLLVSIAVARAFLTAHVKELALRQALGERPATAATRLATKALPSVLIAALTGILLAVALQRFIAAAVFEFAPLSWTLLLALCAAIVATAIFALWSIATLRVANMPLLRALAE
ncbi:hypothetical protein [Pseudomarimonas arenosa]|uniref:FtsX-like permease family protein n=1 Tax=Pseudomarimonas arenosa TaxID=2774145 RepID=A0AAW3ZLL3_9GAMM|nr:hypothetical protein [Pseudomarimonas arenosa]MBD8526077.1 hypothetical protein [Pseudomarimonas arenosa]